MKLFEKIVEKDHRDKKTVVIEVCDYNDDINVDVDD